ncbi:MAG: CRISPR-associated endonuclease Cas2 [bacterium]|nr:CRISPR-associated endonuclease Cas2 [bacterium]
MCVGKNIHYNSLAWEILKVLGSGAVLASLLVAPNMGVLFKSQRRESREDRYAQKRQEIKKALARLRQRRYVRFEIKGGETYLRLTEYGKERLRKFEFDAMGMNAVPSRWDKKWRLIFFDIPEQKRKERKVFRDKIDSLGFFPLQKSVFAYPYPCEDEVDFLTRFLDIERYVYYVESSMLGIAEIKSRRFFELPL